MRFNARCQTDSTTPEDPGHWPRRAPAIEGLMAAERPQLLGLQEMQAWTYGPIEAGLGSTYRSVGVGTRGGSDGLINPIFFDTDRLELLAWNQFRSEERRVGKECRSRGLADAQKKKKQETHEHT